MQRSGEKGAVAVEFALVLLPLVLLLAGIGDVGLLLYNRQAMSGATRVGARFGVSWGNPRPSDADIINLVEDYIKNALDPENTNPDLLDSFDISITRTGNLSGDDLTVTVTHTYTYVILGGLVEALGINKTLTAQTVMQLE